MRIKSMLRAGTIAVALGLTAPTPAALAQQETTFQNAQDGIAIGVGKGTLVRLPRPVTDVMVVNNKVADVQIKSPTQLYLFGVGGGETSFYATDAAGRVVYSANVRVAQNIDQIKSMLGMTMPNAAIEVTPMNGMVLLTGTVASPSEVEEATRLVTAFVGNGTNVVNKLTTAMPVQVNLQVKFAEVSRTALKSIGVNFESMNGGDFAIGFSRGREVLNDAGQFIKPSAGTGIALAGNLLGQDFSAVIDALETDGLLTILAEPNLTALSGETANFLAGGEFPIPTAAGNGATAIEFKEYGVRLAFTPTVLDGNRISMRVQPEVSELDASSGVKVGGFDVPGLLSRRADTTVELGSGQSFMIAGLLRNSVNTSSDRTPLLGNLPILGALFRSTSYRRNETELVIVITPYLVKPVTASKIHLPTDGFRAPSDAERFFEGKLYGKQSAPTPQPKIVPAQPAAPTGAVPAPGFSLN